MLYLITMEKDNDILTSCLRQYIHIDEVVFWENCRQVCELESVGTDDIVIIGIRDSGIRGFVRRLLGELLGVTKVIDFYLVYEALLPFMKVDRVMTDPDYHEYRGVILGLSHAEVGIIQDLLKVPMANLAVSSQDLFYNFATLKYVIEKYSDRFRKMEYLILDMYNYNYFNFDVSLSKFATEYWLRNNGLFEEHNYSHNTNFENNFSEIKHHFISKHFNGITEDYVELWNTIFDINKNRQLRSRHYKTCIDIYKRCQCLNKEILDNFDYYPSVVMKRFDDTVDENIVIFNSLMEYANELNPDIKIYVMLMPISKKAWERGRSQYQEWKPEFERIIRNSEECFRFTYFDWLQSDLSFKDVYWQDTEHLNYYGAICFSKYLNNQLFSA